MLEQFPAVALLGPRQVGKTTLAMSLADSLGDRAVYLDLELPSDRAKLSDAELYLNQHEGRLVILDEIHRLPGLFETLRGLIDRRRRKGNRNRNFLLLGSASIDLLHQSAETLAGRIAYEELTPLCAGEVADLGPDAADRLWVRGGFPDSFLAVDDEGSLLLSSSTEKWFFRIFGEAGACRNVGGSGLHLSRGQDAQAQEIEACRLGGPAADRGATARDR